MRVALACENRIELDPAVLAAFGAGPVLVALSGGGDSTALLHLLRTQIANPLVAGIVDHALRPGSDEIARNAAAAAERLGVPARVETLVWSPRDKQSQAAFRDRRYRALCAIARETGAQVVALGHTADDQLETVAMRATRSAGAAGMSPLAPAPLWPEGRGLTLARPLLHVRRTALRDHLRAHAIAWFDDPANESPRYERIRIRTALAGLSDAEFSQRFAEAGAAQARAEADAKSAAEWLRRWLSLEEGAVSLPRDALDKPGAAHALRAVIAAAAGAASPPALDAVETLRARACFFAFHGATLGGAKLTPRRERLAIARDPGAVLGRQGQAPLPPLTLRPGDDAVWDGRVRFWGASQPLTIAPAGAGGDPARPIVETERGRLPLQDAQNEGLLSFEWLLGAHLSHLLQSFRAAFTGA